MLCTKLSLAGAGREQSSDSDEASELQQAGGDIDVWSAAAGLDGGARANGRQAKQRSCSLDDSEQAPPMQIVDPGEHLD